MNIFLNFLGISLLVYFCNATQCPFQDCFSCVENIECLYVKLRGGKNLCVDSAAANRMYGVRRIYDSIIACRTSGFTMHNSTLDTPSSSSNPVVKMEGPTKVTNDSVLDSKRQDSSRPKVSTLSPTIQYPFNGRETTIPPYNLPGPFIEPNQTVSERTFPKLTDTESPRLDLGKDKFQPKIPTLRPAIQHPFQGKNTTIPPYGLPGPLTEPTQNVNDMTEDIFPTESTLHSIPNEFEPTQSMDIPTTPTHTTMDEGYYTTYTPLHSNETQIEPIVSAEKWATSIPVHNDPASGNVTVCHSSSSPLTFENGYSKYMGKRILRSKYTKPAFTEKFLRSFCRHAKLTTKYIQMERLSQHEKKHYSIQFHLIPSQLTPELCNALILKRKIEKEPCNIPIESK